MDAVFGLILLVIYALGIIFYGVVSIMLARSIHKGRKRYVSYLKNKTSTNLYDFYYKIDLTTGNRIKKGKK